MCEDNQGHYRRSNSNKQKSKGFNQTQTSVSYMYQEQGQPSISFNENTTLKSISTVSLNGDGAILNLEFCHFYRQISSKRQRPNRGYATHHLLSNLFLLLTRNSRHKEEKARTQSQELCPTLSPSLIISRCGADRCEFLDSFPLPSPQQLPESKRKEPRKGVKGL